jgi:hypothetical protein
MHGEARRFPDRPIIAVAAESRLFQAAQYFEEECHDDVRREVERSASAGGKTRQHESLLRQMQQRRPAFTGSPLTFHFQMSCDPGLNSSLMMADEKFHHSVYVILLDPVTFGLPSIVRSNPNRDPAKPCVYVGMTGLPVEQRFENHKKGVKAAWVVKNYGIRLMPELYEYLNPMPFEAAAQMEKDLAADLRADGYTVTGGT